MERSEAWAFFQLQDKQDNSVNSCYQRVFMDPSTYYEREKVQYKLLVAFLFVLQLLGEGKGFLFIRSLDHSQIMWKIFTDAGQYNILQMILKKIDSFNLQCLLYGCYPQYCCVKLVGIHFSDSGNISDISSYIQWK